MTQTDKFMPKSSYNIPSSPAVQSRVEGLFLNLSKNELHNFLLSSNALPSHTLLDFKSGNGLTRWQLGATKEAFSLASTLWTTL